MLRSRKFFLFSKLIFILVPSKSKQEVKEHSIAIEMNYHFMETLLSLSVSRQY